MTFTQRKMLLMATMLPSFTLWKDFWAYGRELTSAKVTLFKQSTWSTGFFKVSRILVIAIAQLMECDIILSPYSSLLWSHIWISKHVEFESLFRILWAFNWTISKRAMYSEIGRYMTYIHIFSFFEVFWNFKMSSRCSKESRVRSLLNDLIELVQETWSVSNAEKSFQIVFLYPSITL